MSIELANEYGSLGQFASNSGYSDLIEVSQAIPTLKKFFDDANTEDVPAVESALERITSPQDVVTTAQQLAALMHGQDLVYITNGTYDKPDEDVAKAGDWVTVNERHIFIGSSAGAKASKKAWDASKKLTSKSSAKEVRNAANYHDDASLAARMDSLDQKNGSKEQKSLELQEEIHNQEVERLNDLADMLEGKVKGHWEANAEGKYVWVDGKGNVSSGKPDLDAEINEDSSKEAQKWANSLSEAEKHAIANYTVNSDGVNDGLRGIKPNTKGMEPEQKADYLKSYKNAQSEAKFIDSAIAKGTLSKPATLYRGADATGMKVGQTITEKGYLSTSREPTVAEEFVGSSEGTAKSAIMVIKAPKGMNVGHMEALSVVPDEREVLFPRGTKYKVDKINNSYEGHYTVHVSMIPK